LISGVDVEVGDTVFVGNGDAVGVLALVTVSLSVFVGIAVGVGRGFVPDGRSAVCVSVIVLAFRLMSVWVAILARVGDLLTGDADELQLVVRNTTNISHGKRNDLNLIVHSPHGSKRI
jgi:hypothetical protein